MDDLEAFLWHAKIKQLPKKMWGKLTGNGWGCIEHNEWFYLKRTAIQHQVKKHNESEEVAKNKIERMKGRGRF